jgi:hypothetical protein
VFPVVFLVLYWPEKLLENRPLQARSYRAATRAERAADCQCGIAVEGTLQRCGYVTNKATKETDWNKGRNVDPSTLRTFEILLKRRLFEYAKHRGFRSLRQLDDLDVVTKFGESWQNLNPHRNRISPAQSKPVPLSRLHETGGIGTSSGVPALWRGPSMDSLKPCCQD